MQSKNSLTGPNTWRIAIGAEVTASTRSRIAIGLIPSSYRAGRRAGMWYDPAMKKAARKKARPDAAQLALATVERAIGGRLSQGRTVADGGIEHALGVAALAAFACSGRHRLTVPETAEGGNRNPERVR